MGRHGYTDDIDDELEAGRWRGMVKSAINGKRGQAMLRDLLAALDAMPEKRLVAGALHTKEGDCCAIGAVCKVRGKDYTVHEEDDEYDLQELNETVAHELDVAPCLVQEIEYFNDELGDKYVKGKRVSETPEERWVRMRAWVAKQIKN